MLCSGWCYFFSGTSDWFFFSFASLQRGSDATASTLSVSSSLCTDNATCYCTVCTQSCLCWASVGPGGWFLSWDLAALVPGCRGRRSYSKWWEHKGSTAHVALFITVTWRSSCSMAWGLEHHTHSTVVTALDLYALTFPQSPRVFSQHQKPKKLWEEMLSVWSVGGFVKF